MQQCIKIYYSIFLMIGGVSLETCWASYKYKIINFDTMLHLEGFFCSFFRVKQSILHKENYV
jgi:hypothetical protein